MQKNRFLTLLLSGALVAAVATGGALLTTGEALLTGGVSTIAPPPSNRQAVATTTTLTTTPTSTAPEGTEVTLTAKITPAAAAGTVQFKDGTNPLGGPVMVMPDGTAAGKTSKLTVGAHQLSAVFTPANPALYDTSTSSQVAFVVTASTAATAKDTSTTLTTSPASPVPQGTQVMLNAAVTPVEAAGAVQFRDGTDPIGGPMPVSNGKASVSTSTLTVGSHQLTAVFTPTNTAYGPSTSQPVTFVITAPVAAATTTTTLTVVPDFPIPQGVPVLLRASVVPDGAAGKVQFQDGTMALGAPVPVVNGSATLITTTLPQGTHSLTAVFIPTNPATYGPSTSPAVSLTVTGGVGSAALERILLRVQQIIQDILDGDEDGGGCTSDCRLIPLDE